MTEGFADPVTTAYEWDVADRMAAVTDADGIETTFDYDQRGLRTAITRGQTTLGYRYDHNGNRTELEHPTGTALFDPTKDVSHWTYDPLDRLSTSTPAQRDWAAADYLRYGPDGVIGPVATVYTYDEGGHGFAAGRVTSVRTPVLATDLHYDADGRVERETRSWSVAPEGTVWSGTAEQLTTYGPTGLPLTVRHADGQTVASYGYDDRAQPARVDVSGGVSTYASLTRNLAGYVTARQTPTAGVGQTWTRDAAARVTGTEIRGAWGCAPSAACPIVAIGGEAATFNTLGNVVSSTERGHDLTFAYGYDERDQLTSATTSDGTSYYGAFNYSGAGRPLSATVTSGLLSADVLTRNVAYDYTPTGVDDTADPAAVRALREVLTDDEVAALVYDASGNLISRTTEDGEHTFVYDGDGKLREATSESTGCFEIYYYDHTGERALTYRGACGDPASVRHRFGTTETFHQTDGTTKSTVDVALADHAVLRITRAAGSATEEHLFHGVLGSLLVTTDAAGQGTTRYGYGPYGEVLYAEGPNAGEFDRRYNGKPTDKLTGLRYYGARHYDPLTLTWTQADPFYRFLPDAALIEPMRMGLYTFNLNNPVRYVDPDGLDSASRRNMKEGAKWVAKRVVKKVIKQAEKRAEKVANGFGAMKMVSAFFEDDSTKAVGRFVNGAMEMIPYVRFVAGAYDAVDSDSDEHTGNAVIGATKWLVSIGNPRRDGVAGAAEFRCRRSANMDSCIRITMERMDRERQAKIDEYLAEKREADAARVSRGEPVVEEETGCDADFSEQVCHGNVADPIEPARPSDNKPPATKGAPADDGLGPCGIPGMCEE